MQILLSNDDGCQADGLRCLRQQLAARYADTVVVAPDRNRSGASNSLTLDRPLHARQCDADCYCIDGTPTDCVHLAMTGLLEKAPDIVVSGINAGANLGDDVLYSGTVAAAMEGRFLGLPAIALSLAGEQLQHYATAARVALDMIDLLQRQPLPVDTILNVNVPDLPWEELQGYAATRLGMRHRAKRIVADRDPRGRRIYWVGSAGDESDASPGTDFHAIAVGKVSITPIVTDRTRYAAMDQLQSWALQL